MTPEQKAAIVYLREQGLGYKAIGVKLSLSSNTIKSFCRREAIKTGEKTDEMITLNNRVFGMPLREDILHRVVVWQV